MSFSKIMWLTPFPFVFFFWLLFIVKWLWVKLAKLFWIVIIRVGILVWLGILNLSLKMLQTLYSIWYWLLITSWLSCMSLSIYQSKQILGSILLLYPIYICLYYTRIFYWIKCFFLHMRESDSSLFNLLMWHWICFVYIESFDLRPWSFGCVTAFE